MKLLFRLAIISSLLTFFIFISCKKDSENKLELNVYPVANAGKDMMIYLPVDSVLLDGSNSHDPDGTIRNVAWEKVASPGASTIVSPTAIKTMVKNFTKGIYKFLLKVTDEKGAFSIDTIQVIVSSPLNSPPLAKAGADQTLILPNNKTSVDGGTSADPDNNIIQYTWKKIQGPDSYSIITPNGSRTEIHNLSQGIYMFELEVMDAETLKSKDSIQITVTVMGCGDLNRILVNAQLIPVGYLSIARVGSAVVSAGNKILFAGSLTQERRVDIYDISTNTWSTAELSNFRHDIAVVAAGTKIFFAGGKQTLESNDAIYANVDIYDVVTNTWSTASLSEPRAFIAAATVGNKVFFAGGENDGGYGASNVVDIYDLTTNTWSTKNLDENKIGISAVTHNNKVYFAGGSIGSRWSGTLSNRIDIFDNATNSWSSTNLQIPQSFAAGISVGDDIMWASGCDVEIKNVNTGLSTINQLFGPGKWYNNRGANSVRKDNKILFFRQDAFDATNFDIYDIPTKTWSIGVLPLNLSQASVISVNNVVYLAGGIVNGSYYFSSQVYKVEF